MEKDKQQQAVELTSEQLEQVNGGMELTGLNIPQTEQVGAAPLFAQSPLAEQEGLAYNKDNTKTCVR